MTAGWCATLHYDSPRVQNDTRSGVDGLGSSSIRPGAPTGGRPRAQAVGGRVLAIGFEAGGVRSELVIEPISYEEGLPRP